MTHQRPDGDALGSVLASFLTFKKMGKQVAAVCVDPVPKVFNFLPAWTEITSKFNAARDFIITLDASQNTPDKIFYKVEDNKLNIVVTPKSGQYTSEMVTFKDGGFKYDLIIVLDSTDPERLGISFEQNPDLFFETPVINIDHHAGNDYFGKINIVDFTATSTSEILVSLIESLGQKLDEDVATALLTGITTDTGSFQNANTTPKSLTIAAQLVAAGARQQEMVKNIYKTKPLSTLRLWGIALSKMRMEDDFKFLWSTLGVDDFESVGAAEDESAGVLDELLKTASGVDFVMLLSERNGGVHGSLRNVAKGVDVSAIATLFGGGGHAAAAAFQVADSTLPASKEMIIKKIKDFLGGRVVEKYNNNNDETRKILKVEPMPAVKTPVEEQQSQPKEMSTETANIKPQIPNTPKPELQKPVEMPALEQEVTTVPEEVEEPSPIDEILSQDAPVEESSEENPPKW